MKNNGGGHLNHDFFWSVHGARARTAAAGRARTKRSKNTSVPSRTSARSSATSPAKHFASGWVALALDHASHKLEILDLKDHEIVTPGDQDRRC